jgi:conjugative relaxase-like TrwC/TraI family protein
MLSIGKLAPGPQAATYFLQRVGCPMEYYTGRGEAPGVWIGKGARALGLIGSLGTPEGDEILRRLLGGQAPDGTQLVKPVLRADPRGRVPAATVASALARVAEARNLDVPALLRTTPDKSSGTTSRNSRPVLVREWERMAGELERARRRPRWPAPSLPAEVAQRLLTRAGLDPAEVLGERTPTGRFRDLLARALAHREDRVDVRVPGLDLTLSAPKSVSLLWALGDDPEASAQAPTDVDGAIARTVKDAHRLAVQEALEYLELTCTSAQRGHHRGDGTDRRVDTHGLIASAFEHRSSRCGDPQLHTHVVVANLLHGQDGQWSALDTREIYAHARTAGFIYQAVLRGELTRTLGVSWTPVRNGQAEIAGMPPRLLRLFSKRRAQIEAQLDQLGLDTPQAAQAATLDTRPAKAPEPADGEVRLQDRWRAESTAAGHRPDALARVLHQPEARSLVTSSRAAAAGTGSVPAELADTLLAEQGLTDKRATFDRRDLLRGVCEQLPAGLPIRLTGLRALATRVLGDERVVPLLGEVPTRSRRYSTRELLALEADALARAQRAQPSAAEHDRGQDIDVAPVAVVPDAVLVAAQQQAAERGCTPEQTSMVRRLLSSGAGFEVVVGAAGSGKTTALAVAAEAWRDAGIAVHGTALAAIAARVLQDSAGMESRSLQRLLNELASTDSNDRNGSALPVGGVLVVDEAGMVGTRTLHQLLVLAEQHHTKLVLVGDPHQLPEIQAGGLFATLAARLPAIELLSNQRQCERWEQCALAELRAGDVVRAVSAYARHDRLRIEDGLDTLTDRLLTDYEQHLTAHTPDQVLVVASSRGDARRLNALLRQRLLEHGRLGTDELRITLTDPRDPAGTRGERGYRQGEQVLVCVNDYPRGLLNGTRGTVTALHRRDQELDVRLDDGRELRLDREYLQSGQLRHGYALTAHKAQGITVDVSLLWGTQALARETGYVALSRGRHANYLYSTWDLLRRDTDLADYGELDRPAAAQGRPDAAARRGLARAALAERLGSSARQRTARSWWRRRADSATRDTEPSRGVAGVGGR